MDIKEFLMQNYIWLVVVGLLVIITIIGFIADKKRKTKASDTKNNESINQNDMTQVHQNNVMNTVSDIQSNVNDVNPIAPQPVDVLTQPMNSNINLHNNNSMMNSSNINLQANGNPINNGVFTNNNNNIQQSNPNSFNVPLNSVNTVNNNVQTLNTPLQDNVSVMPVVEPRQANVMETPTNTVNASVNQAPFFGNEPVQQTNPNNTGFNQLNQNNNNIQQ